MKKILQLLLVTFAFIIFSCTKESDIQELPKKIIQTEFGIKHVFKSDNGNYVIEFSKSEWREILTSLKFNESKAGRPNSTIIKSNDEDDIDISNKGGKVALKFKIATRKSNCKGGIGFRCGGSVTYSQKMEIQSSSVEYGEYRQTSGSFVGRNLDRYYYAIVEEVDGRVYLEFQEPVDWSWLEIAES